MVTKINSCEFESLNLEPLKLDEKIMQEKREYRRFKLCLDSEVGYTDQNGREKQINLKTNNISCKGVFLKTFQPLALGTKLKLKIFLPIGNFMEDQRKSVIQCQGTVVRALYSKGMAVCFDKKCRICPLEKAD